MFSIRLAIATAIVSSTNAFGVTPSTTILESATPPASIFAFPLALDQFQYEGCRFHVSQLTLVDHVGGDAGGDPGSGQLFAAIAALTSPNGFPDLTPKEFQPLAITTFVPSLADGDKLVPLSVLLPTGDYGLIFGSDRFGATGNGGVSRQHVETLQASFFQGSIESTTSNGVWNNDSGLHNERFLVFGTTVPEPAASMMVILSGCIVISVNRNRRRP